MKGTKKILSVVLSVIMVLSVIPMGVFTASAATDGVFMYSISGGEATIIGCDTKATGDLFIPSTLEECPVTEISLYSFAQCESITGISIPDSVKKIGDCAFSDCTALKNVIIGKGLEKLGNSVFSNCTALEKFSVAADNAVYSSDETGVLYNKDKTALLIFPAANAATTYKVAENVRTIADNTFLGTANVKTIEIGDNVTSIGANAFLGGRSLETVIIGKGVASIGSDAFEGCAKLTGISVSADNAVYSSDANGVLYNKAKTEIIKYPAGNTKTTFTVPAGVTDLKILSFSNALNLTSVTFSKDLKNIGASAFSGCNNISEVYFEGSEAEWKEVTIGSNNNAILNAKMTYGRGEEHGHSYTSYETTVPTCTEKGVRTYKCDCGHSYTEAIAAKGHDFKDNVCSRCSVKEFELLTDGTNAKVTGYNGVGGAVVINETIGGYKITAIGDDAFENKTEVTSITLPATVKDIGTCAFYKTGYYNTSSNWENGVLYIGSFLIEANDTVKGAYTVKDATTVVADFAFASAKELTSVTLPAGIEVIGDSAFSGCTGLTDVTVGVTEEEWKAVTVGTGNENFTKAKFTYKVVSHEHVYTVTENAAPTCTTAGYRVSKCECGDIKREDFAALGHKFTNNVCTGCGEREFNISISGEEVTILGCHESLSGEVEIPENVSGYKVTAIAEKAFAGNEKIEKLVIPAGVKSIGDMAFAGSKIVVEVAGENENYLTDNGILYNKTRLTILYCPASKAAKDVQIPDGVTSIGAGAFCGISTIESVKIPESVISIGEDAFSGCSGIKNVYYDGSRTEWGKINIAEGNEELTNAEITCADTSDVELAAALVEKISVSGATKKAEDIVIVITAGAEDKTIIVSNKTADDKAVTIKTEGTLITANESEYVLTFADWHKAGNSTETEITCDGNTFTVKFIFPVGDDDGHVYSIIEKIEPTCAASGATRYTCSICGAYEDKEPVEKLGHTYGDWYIETDETCTENGVKMRECSVCAEDTEGHFETGVVLAKGHNYTVAVTEPTCTEGGYITYTCADCGDSYVGNPTAALGHTYGDWNVTTAAQCEAAGEKIHVCTVCASEEKETIPATGHKYVGTVIAPTYTSEGYTEYKCENCEASYKADYVDMLSRLISVSVENITLNKDEQVTIKPDVACEGNAKWTAKYEIADATIATIDEDGVLTGKNRGVTQVTCTITDEQGNTVTDVFSVEVKFTILQWITWFFVDLIFGFISDLFAPQA